MIIKDIEADDIQIIKDAIDALLMQRSSLDQEQNTDGKLIQRAQDTLEKFELNLGS